MEKLFVAFSDGTIVAVIKAEGERDVKNKLAKLLMEDEATKEYINSFAVNDGLHELFNRDDQGYILNDMGGLKDHIKAMKEDEQDSYIFRQIEKNVNEFWKDTPNLAEEYMREYIASLNIIDKGFYPSFSDEFYFETTKLLFDNDYYDKIIIAEIKLENDTQIIHQW